jgi:uncharacterized protein (UPF0332 family)
MWDWSEYLRLAEKLAKTNEASQAELRCATSRAYYAALHAAVALLETTHPNIRNESKLHDAVYTLLKSKGFKAWVSLNFAIVKRNRILADYKSDENIDWNDVANRTIHHTNLLIREFHRLAQKGE